MRRIVCVVAIIAGVTSTACVARTEPHGCIVLVPHSDEDPHGVAFSTWSMRHHGPLDYRQGAWYDANGVVIGTATAEDSVICEVTS